MVRRCEHLQNNGQKICYWLDIEYNDSVRGNVTSVDMGVKSPTITALAKPNRAVL